MRASIICVTHRPVFWDWLTWNVAKQTERDAELVVVLPTDLPDAAWARLVALRPGLPVKVIALDGTLGARRQAATDAAEGEVVLHFDDDDWQHPRRVEWACGALGAANDVAAVAGSAAFMLRLETGRAYRHTGALVHSLAAFRREACRHARYPDLDYAEDTPYLTACRPVSWATEEDQSFWLMHPRNTSPRPSVEESRRLVYSLHDVRRGAGQGWQDTDERLDELRRVACGSPDS